jgi:hypothetical protein
MFSIIYYELGDKYFASDQSGTTDKKLEYLDTLYFTTTIQAGVGLASLRPLQDEAKFIVCIQQFVMIATNVILLYAFTI